MQSKPQGQTVPMGKKSIKEIDSMLKYAHEARVSNVSLAIDLAQKAKGHAEVLNYLEGLAQANCSLGLFYMIVGNHELAETFTNEALSVFKDKQNQSGVAECLYILGSIAYKSARHHEGLELLYDGLRISQELEDVGNQSRTLKAIGYIYDSFQEYDKAQDIYERCQALSQQIDDKNGESNACNSLSALYLRNGDIVSASETIDRSIELKKQTGDKRGLAFAYYGKGKIHLHLEEFDKAEEYILKSLSKHEYVGEKIGTAMCYAKLGQIAFGGGKLADSKDHFSKSLACGELLENDEVRYHAYEFLYKIAKQEGNTQEALAYHEKFHECKFRVVNGDTKSRIKSLESMWRMESLENQAQAHKDKAEFMERKNQELRRFVSRVSHDLKGPLSSMIQLHKVIEAEITDESSLYYFNLYNKGLKRLNETILDLLELSKLNSRELAYSDINFEDLIRECLDSFHYYPNFSAIDFQIAIDPNLKVSSDVRLLNTVIQNLLENSIKYARSGKEKSFVKVSVQTMAEDYFALIVEDNGLGIEAEYQEKVFDMFFRANDDVDGSGLGLFLLKTAVEKLNGDVDLESESGKGTKFIVILPI